VLSVDVKAATREESRGWNLSDPVEGEMKESRT
jgi:hypothetical protein